MQLHAITDHEVCAMQDKKRQERGGFEKRIFITHAECLIGSFG